MAYDAAAVIEAMRAPEVRILRARWWEKLLVRFGILESTVLLTGRLMSHQEWLPIEAAWARVGSMEASEVKSFLDDVITRSGFNPRRFDYMPWNALIGVVTDFLACHADANRPPPVPEVEPLPPIGISSTPAVASPNGTEPQGIPEPALK